MLLDADGTLFDYDKAEAIALERTFQEAGLAFAPDYARAYRQVNARIWRAFERGQISAERLRVRRFELLFEAVQVELDPARFSGQYLAQLAMRSELVEGAEALLEALHGQVGLMIITNGLEDVQRSRFARSAIQSYITDVVISEEVGAAKPAPLIFDAAFERMGHPDKEEVLIVGDSLSSDIQGGHDYGIDTCWFNPAGKPRPEDVGIRYEIGRLDELLPIVGISVI